VNKEEIIEKLKDVIRGSSQEQVDPSSIKGDTTIESMGFDSLSILDLIYDIQQAFDVEFDAEEMVKVKTVNDLADFLAQKQ